MKEIKRLKMDLASAERAMSESPYTVETLQAEADAIKTLLLERVRKRRLIIKEQQEQEKLEAEKDIDEPADEARSISEGDAGSGVSEHTEGSSPAKEAKEMSAIVVDVGREAGKENYSHEEDSEEKNLEENSEEDLEQDLEEGPEVDGPFDPEPVLLSRFGDKSNSMRFVTAEEDARMRREELAKVFGARTAASTAEASDTLSAGRDAGAQEEQESGEHEKPTTAGQSPAIAAPSPAAWIADKCPDQVEGGQQGGGLVGGDGTKSRMMAFGAILEKTLSQSLLGRKPPPGSSAPAACVQGVAKMSRGGLNVQGSMSHPNRSSTSKASIGPAGVLSPPCKPKSKFFRSINPSIAPDAGRASPPTDNLARTRQAAPPMLGLLSQIRARGGGGDGETKAVMGGLLAQIRAKSSAATAGVRQDVGATQEGLRDDVDISQAGDASAHQPVPPPPPPPQPSLHPRSLFGNAASSSSSNGGVQGGGPPPNFLAEVRAKAAAREASRRAVEGGA